MGAVRNFRVAIVFGLLAFCWLLGEWLSGVHFGQVFPSEVWFYALIFLAGVSLGRITGGVNLKKFRKKEKTGNALLQKFSEDMIFEAEERFYKAFFSNPAMMALADFTTGRLIDINQSLLTSFEAPRQAVVGKKLLDLVDQVDDYPVFIKILRQEGRVFNQETWIQLRNGKRIAVMFSLETIELDGAKCVLVVANDITNVKEMQKEMARLDRLNLIGEMAAGIGHEIRNPMTAVRGFIQLLDNQEENPKKKEYYAIMIEELDRANSIITEYLSLAKHKAVTKKSHSLNAIINSLFPLLSVDALKQDKHLVLQKREIPNLLVNEKEIRQLILNLVKNGLDAMPGGGVLTLGTSTQGNEVVLFVEDQGTGIDPAILDKLGNPFVTTKENGTGLGIPVCYSIAKRHNAKIHIETSPRGTKFSVVFS